MVGFFTEKISKQRGFTMVEMIVSLAVLSFGILGVYAIFFPSFNAIYDAANRLTAIYLTQEALETVRNIRDNNFIMSDGNPGAEWSDGLTGCETGCQLDYKTGTSVETYASQMRSFNPGEYLKTDADGFYGYDSGNDTKFQRKITITPVAGTDTLRALVSVTWNYSGEERSFEAIEYLYNWR